MYVLRYTREGHREVNPEPHYLYKSVTKHRQGWLNWSLTTRISDARQWATEDGATGYAARLHDSFTVEFIDDSAEKAAEARAKELLEANRNLTYTIDRYDRGDLTIAAVREALTRLSAAIAAMEAVQ